MPNKTSLAKITRPRTSGAFERKRLFTLLDQHQDKPVIWISSPAGAGKTTLVGSYLDYRKLSCLWYQLDQGDKDIATFFYYMGLAGLKAAEKVKRPLPLLTPEYQFGIPVFTRRYFEDLFGRLKSPAAVVLDNYQEVGEGTGFPSMLRDALAVIPPEIQVIVISRLDPPDALASFRANGGMEVLGWDELRLNEEEVNGMLALRRGPALTGEAARRIHETTQGWAAGIVLMTEEGRDQPGAAGVGSGTRESVFGYFAGELFQRADGVTRDFLLKTGLLPDITVAAAERLTGLAQAGQILSDLVRRNFFTVRKPGSSVTYEYHPLFREFLLARAIQSYTAEELGAVRRDAAGLLAQIGQIDAAARLYRETGDWKILIGLILAHAPSLIKQGRIHTIGEWLSSIPSEYRENHPWLIYWQGICRMPFDLQESRKALEDAYGKFKDRGDAAGIYLAWTGIVDTIVYRGDDFMLLNHWIEEIESILLKYPDFPSPEIEARATHGIFCALMYRRPDHPDILQWADRAMAIVMRSDDVHLRMLASGHLILYHAWWRGDVAKASLLVDILHRQAQSRNISPVSRIVWVVGAAANAWITGEGEQAISFAESGLELAESSGVHVWDYMLLLQCTMNTLTLRDMSGADAYLQRLSAVAHRGRKGDTFVYYWQLGWKALSEGRYAAALEHEQTGLKIARDSGIKIGICTMLQGAAEALIELGDFDRSRRYIEEAKAIALATRSFSLECKDSWLNALFHLRQGERDKAVHHMRRYLAESRAKGINCHLRWRPQVMAEFYGFALEEGIETDHVQKLIQLHRLAPPQTMRYRENWPWPVRIHTLGGFKLLVQGKPVRFSRKAPKKLLETLKALIASGRTEMNQETLAAALWPEADGDLANQSLAKTLKRLRALINIKDVLDIHEGRLRLDPRSCWVDAWAFEQIIDEDGEARDLPRHEKALALYKGPFLPDDTDKSWSFSFREGLRIKFIRSLERVGLLHERAGDVKKAVACYEKGLEADDLAEEFYRRLMDLYERMGRRAEALAVYRRCRRSLAAHGIEPSSETETIAWRLKQQS